MWSQKWKHKLFKHTMFRPVADFRYYWSQNIYWSPVLLDLSQINCHCFPTYFLGLASFISPHIKMAPPLAKDVWQVHFNSARLDHASWEFAAWFWALGITFFLSHACLLGHANRPIMAWQHVSEAPGSFEKIVHLWWFSPKWMSTRR